MIKYIYNAQDSSNYFVVVMDVHKKQNTEPLTALSFLLSKVFSK